MTGGPAPETRDRLGREDASAAAADEELARLVGDRFDELMATWPSLATSLGIHELDGRLADLSRAAMEADIAAERRFIDALERFDAERLSDAPRFEREVALHGARLRLFRAEVVRGWERRLSAAEEIGDALFLLLARDVAPLVDRLERMTERLEGVPLALQQVRDRLAEQPVRLWNELEVQAARDLPVLVGQVEEAARSVWESDRAAWRRLDRASRAADSALDDYATWLTRQLPRFEGGMSLGRQDLDALIELRAFDGLSVDDILAIGWEQLESLHEARRAAGRHIDPDASEDEIVARVKSEGPPDFEGAIAAYRDAMLRARRYVDEHDLATLPAEDHLEVMPTPRFMRRSMPLAAYFGPAAFDRPARGVYVVTPSVDDDPAAMREHNWSSIVNTSVHEAYPGHHHQLTAALASSSPARLLTEAPELIEGWGMYCEELMLEAGFEDTPQRRVIVATDAIWRACRIILDIRLHRAEIGIGEAIDFLIEHTGFEAPVARAEVQRYTQSPGYNLSYLLGKVLLLGLRADEQRRLGTDFSLKAFHDALLYSGSLPISFHRRLLAGEGGGPTPPPSDGRRGSGVGD